MKLLATVLSFRGWRNRGVFSLGGAWNATSVFGLFADLNGADPTMFTLRHYYIITFVSVPLFVYLNSFLLLCSCLSKMRLHKLKNGCPSRINFYGLLRRVRGLFFQKFENLDKIFKGEIFDAEF